MIISLLSSAHVRLVALGAQDRLGDLPLVAHLPEVRKFFARGRFSVGPDRIIVFIPILKSNAIRHFLIKSVLALSTVVDLIVGLRKMMSLTSVTALSLLSTLLRNDADGSRETPEAAIMLNVSGRQLRDGHYCRLFPDPLLVSGAGRILMAQVVLVLLLLREYRRLNARILLQNRVLVVGRVKVVVIA